MPTEDPGGRLQHRAAPAPPDRRRYAPEPAGAGYFVAIRADRALERRLGAPDARLGAPTIRGSTCGGLRPSPLGVGAIRTIEDEKEGGRQLEAIIEAIPQLRPFLFGFECELLARTTLSTHAEARAAIFEFIEGWYNTRRRHSALSYASPLEFERLHAAVPVGGARPVEALQAPTSQVELGLPVTTHAVTGFAAGA